MEKPPQAVRRPGAMRFRGQIHRSSADGTQASGHTDTFNVSLEASAGEGEDGETKGFAKRRAKRPSLGMKTSSGVPTDRPAAAGKSATRPSPTAALTARSDGGARLARYVPGPAAAASRPAAVRAGLRAIQPQVLPFLWGPFCF